MFCFERCNPSTPGQFWGSPIFFFFSFFYFLIIFLSVKSLSQTCNTTGYLVGVFPVNSLQPSATLPWPPQSAGLSLYCFFWQFTHWPDSEITGISRLSPRAATGVAQPVCLPPLAFQFRFFCFFFSVCFAFCRTSWSWFVGWLGFFSCLPFPIHWLVYSFHNFLATSCFAGIEAEWEKIKFKSTFTDFSSAIWYRSFLTYVCDGCCFFLFWEKKKKHCHHC